MTATRLPIATFLIVLTAGLAFVSAASAGPANQLSLSGRATTEMRLWAEEASTNVPLPKLRLAIRNGNPMLAGTATIYLPFAWGTLAVHGLFLHELGHAYDSDAMTGARRQEFLQIAGVTCSWTAAHCRTARWVSGPGFYVDVKPQEMFAEMYAACALGLTERGYQDAGYNTYGWVPPDGADAALCGVIRGQGAATAPLAPSVSG